MQVSSSFPQATVRFAARKERPDPRRADGTSKPSIPEGLRLDQDQASFRVSKFAYMYPSPVMEMCITSRMVANPEPIVRDFVKFFTQGGYSEEEVLQKAENNALVRDVSSRAYEKLDALKKTVDVTYSTVNSIGLTNIAILHFQLNEQLLAFMDQMIEKAEKGEKRTMIYKSESERDQELKELGGFLAEHGFTAKWLEHIAVTPDQLGAINDLLLSRPVEELKAIREKGNVFKTMYETTFQLTEFRKLGVMLPELWQFLMTEAETNKARGAMTVHGALNGIQEGIKTGQIRFNKDQIERIREIFHSPLIPDAIDLYQDLNGRIQNRMDEVEKIYQERTRQFAVLNESLQNIQALDEVFPNNFVTTQLRGLPDPALDNNPNDPAVQAAQDYQEKIGNFREMLTRKLQQLLPLISVRRQDIPDPNQAFEINPDNPIFEKPEVISYEDKESKFRKTFRHYRLQDGREVYADIDTGEWHVGKNLTPERIMKALKTMDHQGKGPLRRTLRKMAEKLGLNDGVAVGQEQKTPITSRETSSLLSITNAMPPIPALPTSTKETDTSFLDED